MVSAPTVAKPWGAGGWRLCPGRFSASAVRNSRSPVDSSDRPPGGFPTLVAGFPGQTFGLVCLPVRKPDPATQGPRCRGRPGGLGARRSSKSSRSSFSPKAVSYAAAGSPIGTPAPFVPNAFCECPGSGAASVRFAACLHPPGNCRFRIRKLIPGLQDPARTAGSSEPSITRPGPGDRTRET